MIQEEYYIKEIDELIENGMRNRKEMLYRLITDYDDLKILTCLISRMDRIAIKKELKLPLQKIDDTTQKIEDLSRLIDSRINKKFSSDFINRRNAKTSESDGKRTPQSDESPKMVSTRKALNKFYASYIRLKEKGELDPELVKSRLDELIKKIKFMGNKPQDLFFLTQVYMDLDDVANAKSTIYSIKPEFLSTEDERKYQDLKESFIVFKNRSMIREWYFKDKMSYMDILDKREQTPDMRREASFDFINKVVHECMKENEEMKKRDIQKKRDSKSHDND